MLGDIIDLILYPVEQLFGLLTSEAIEDYLGVSVLGIVVTTMCISIVIRALISSTGVGSAIASLGNTQDAISSERERTHERLVNQARTSAQRRHAAAERLRKGE